MLIRTFFFLALWAFGLALPGWAQQRRPVSVQARTPLGKLVDIDMGGTWRGGLSNGSAWPFRVTMEVRAQGGNALAGLVRYNASKENGQLVEKFTGLAAGTSFSFNETAVVAGQTSDDWEWCIKEGEGDIVLEDSTIIIRGRWHGRADGLVYAGGQLTKGHCNPGYFELRKPYRPIPPIPPVPPAPTDEEQQAAEADPNADIPSLPIELLGRRVVMVDSFMTNTGRLTLRYRDSQKVDGDVVSLNQDGRSWLGQHLKLHRRYRRLRFTMHKRVAYIIMYAENAGRGGKSARNTAHFKITDGYVKKERDFDSNAGVSQAIKIVRQAR